MLDLNSITSKSYINFLDSKSPVNSIPLETSKSQIAINSAKNSRSSKKSKYPEKIISPKNSKFHKNKNINLELNTFKSELPSFLVPNKTNVNNSQLSFLVPNNYDVNTGNNELPSLFVPKNTNVHFT